MTPEDKKKLQDAWKKAIDNDPRADTPMLSVPSSDGTLRKLMEESLASEAFYQKIDKLLKAHPELTVDQFIEAYGGASAKKKPGPKP